MEDPQRFYEWSSRLNNFPVGGRAVSWSFLRAANPSAPIIPSSCRHACWLGSLLLPCDCSMPPPIIRRRRFHYDRDQKR